MLPTLLLLAMTLPQADVNQFAARVAQALAQRPGARVLLSVEDTAATGASEQLARALRESLRQRGFELTAESDAAVQVNAWLSLRRGRPLAVARITAEGREAAILFAEFELAAQPATPVSERPAVAIRTRTLIESDLPVLDIETDSAGNLFVLHTDRLRAYDLNAAGTPLKAEIGLETGSGRQRDPLVRLFAR